MIKHTLGLGSSDKMHEKLKQLKWLNSQTSKEVVKLKKFQTVETVKRHKSQREAELARTMDKINQKAKLGQKV